MRNVQALHPGHDIAIALRFMPAFASLFLLLAPARANTTLFTYSGYSNTTCTVYHLCSAAGDFGVLVGLGGTGTMSITANDNTLHIQGAGEIGFGAGSNINAGTHTESIVGPIDFADPLSTTVTSGHCPTGNCYVPTTAANTMTNVTLTGAGTRSDSAWVNTALQQVSDMSAFWKNYGTQTTIAAGKLGRTGSGGVATITGNGGVRVFTTSSVSTNTTLNISGGANDLIVVNVTGSAVFGNNISLSGGITPEQVLFNILGTASNALTINGGTIAADFFIANASYSVSNATVSGRILGGKGTDTWGSSFTLNVPADVTPEPGTWVMIGAGLGALIWFDRRRRA